MIYFFEFVYVVDYIDGFPYIEPILQPWDEVYLIVVIDHFDVFLDSVGIGSREVLEAWKITIIQAQK